MQLHACAGNVIGQVATYDWSSIIVGEASTGKGLLVAAKRRIVHPRSPLLRHHLLFCVQLPEHWRLHRQTILVSDTTKSHCTEKVPAKYMPKY